MKCSNSIRERLLGLVGCLLEVETLERLVRDGRESIFGSRDGFAETEVCECCLIGRTRIRLQCSRGAVGDRLDVTLRGENSFGIGIKGALRSLLCRVLPELFYCFVEPVDCLLRLVGGLPD